MRPLTVAALLAFALMSGCGDSAAPVPDSKQMSVRDDFFEVRPVDKSGKKAGSTKMKINSTGDELFIENHVVINMADVRSCRQEKDYSGTYSIVMTLTQEASNRFSRFTAEHIRERAAILLDKKVVIAPIVMQEIKGPDVIIGGRFSENDARALIRRITGEPK